MDESTTSNGGHLEHRTDKVFGTLLAYDHVLGKNLIDEEIVGVSVIDGLHVQGMNARCAKIFGLTKRDFATPIPICRLVAPADQELVRTTLENQFRGTAKQLHFEFRCLSPGQDLIWIELTALPMRVRNDAAILCTIIDITARKRTEATLRAVLKARNQFSIHLDQKTILEKMGKLFVPELADAFIVDLFDSNRRKLSPAILMHRQEERANVFGHVWQEGLAAETKSCISSRVAQAGQPELISRTVDGPAQEPGTTELMDKLEIASLMSVPIRDHQKILGTMTFISNRASRNFNRSEIDAATDFANGYGIFLENTSLHSLAQSEIRLRDASFSIASHELKTPVTVLQGTMEFIMSAIRRGRTIPEQTMLELCSNAHSQSKRLVTLVHKMLDSTRLSSGDLELEFENFDLSAMVQDLLRQLKPAFERAGCELTYSAMSSAQGWWDRTRVEEILVNLVNNALKYGAGRPIEVSVSTNETHARLAVRDQGIGIADEDQARIFKQFERVASSKKRDSLGLGLFIVQQIVKAHGGSIHVESTLGCGSEFIVELPLRASDQP